MVRKLKHHEQRLLRKVDFLTWNSDSNHREHDIMRRYHIQDSATYHKYNKLCGSVRQLAHKLAQLPPEDEFRRKHEDMLLEKLFIMGVLNSKSKMSDVENKVSVAAFCRRRLPIVMTRLRMAENVPAAVKFIEQGHVRVGPEVITDPAFLVTRNLEDFVTWVDSSKIKRSIMKYRDKVDDFDLL
ncbi:Small subunit (SSU) processome component [Arthrobotrys conoides]|uniref:U3 small nucleolar ribonucleoprotein protein IMP3 n=1 Tax=Arthrobotrys conoides TaxID=74498 RepID=A0AAN8NS13_9PEZI